jgi:hypothetical protein
MRRIVIVALSAALLTTTAWVVHGAAAGSTGTARATAPWSVDSGPPSPPVWRVSWRRFG